MIVKSISLRNFRNYERLDLPLNPKMNIITGDNAQGKTNMLESLVYLSLSRSHRITGDEKLIREGCEFSRIECTLQDEKQTKLSAVIHKRGKTLMINQIPVKKSSEFVGKLNVVLFSPDDMSLFIDAPRERRKIMSQEISKISPKYVIAMNHYRSLLKDRNSLLKQNHIDMSYLDIIDEQMIQEEKILIRAERAFVTSINHYLDHFYKEISDDTIHVNLRLMTCIDNEDIEEGLKELYKKNRQRDIDTHVTNAGVHRDDLRFEFNEKNVIEVASQGQKRMLLLSFKLSILEFIKEVTHENAVLLLDDVLSELDIKRQRKFIEMIQNSYQCVITTAEIPDFLKYANASIYYVENGKIKGGRV